MAAPTRALAREALLHLDIEVEELPAVYARIAELLRSQYLLWYPSPSDKPPEQFRKIEVTVANPTAVVKTIAGYYPGK